MMAGSLTHRVRCRVGGIVIRQDSILLVQMDLPTRTEPVWMPPGGEIEFGETFSEALVREFREETGLQVKVEQLAYVSEFLEPPFHAVEHYFRCRPIKGELAAGEDPEYEQQEQFIRRIAYHPLKSLPDINVEPAYLTDRLQSDWRNHKLTEVRWINRSSSSTES